MVLKKKLFAAIFAVSLATTAFAAKGPALRGRVNDYANVISSHDEQEMNNYLAAVEQKTGAQVAVLTVPSLQGEDIASYAFKVCEEWQNDFNAFETWAFDNGYRPGCNLSLDRIDVNKGYSPDNCRYANNFVQSVNKNVLFNETTGLGDVTKEAPEEPEEVKPDPCCERFEEKQ